MRPFLMSMLLEHCLEAVLDAPCKALASPSSFLMWQQVRWSCVGYSMIAMLQ